MKARIRYKKLDSQWAVSTTTFNTKDKGQVKVRLNENANEFQVVSLVKSDILVSGSGVNSHDTKKKAKQALRDLGTDFAPEFRMRGAEALLEALGNDD